MKYLSWIGLAMLSCGCAGSSGSASPPHPLEVSIDPMLTSSSPVGSAAPSVARHDPSEAPLSDEERLRMELIEKLEHEARVTAANSSGLTFGVGPSTNVGGIGGLAGVGGVVGPSTTSPPLPGSKVAVTAQTLGTIDNVDNVVAGMKAGFRRCHRKILDQNPNAAGVLVVRADIDKSGSVTRAKIVQPNSSMGEAAQCAAARITAAQFAPPKGGRAVLIVTITFSVDP